MAKTKEENKQEFVTKDYLDEQLGKILNVVEKMSEQNATPAQLQKFEATNEEKAEARPNTNLTPAEWDMYIDNHLGKNVGRSVSYPKAGTGIMLRLSIPKELSNSGESHWDYYHHDIRSKAIDPREGFEGVKRFVDLVAQNLKLDMRAVADINNKNLLK